MDAEDLDHYLPDIPEKATHFPNQKEIKNVIKNISLTKSNAKLFLSRMKKCDLVKDV